MAPHQAVLSLLLGGGKRRLLSVEELEGTGLRTQ